MYPPVMAEDIDYDTDFPSFVKDGNHDSPPPPGSTALSPSSPPSTPPSQPSSSPLRILTASPSSNSLESVDMDYPPRPRSPFAFIWRCHLCGARYPLGATRRCLVDGHYYCYGQGTGKNIKRKRRGKACPAIFDYHGWEDWNKWREQTRDYNFLFEKEGASPTPATRTNCWEDCHFPSACRYIETVHGEEDTEDPDFVAGYLLRRKLTSAKKRKKLLDSTEGVNYLPPAKIPKFRPTPEPEPEPEPMSEPEPLLELEPQPEQRDEEEKTEYEFPVEYPRPLNFPTTPLPGLENPIMPGLTLTNPQPMLCVQINVSEHSPMMDEDSSSGA